MYALILTNLGDGFGLMGPLAIRGFQDNLLVAASVPQTWLWASLLLRTHTHYQHPKQWRCEIRGSTG